MLVPFARRINAAVGATRSAVEAGIAPPECLIDQSSRTICPLVYVAFGISGENHHMLAIRGTKLVVSVNWDIEAPIVRQSDIVLVN
ncbi:MAG: FAD-binding protein, partial [Candidatus Hodgkinia cicadicola]